MDGRQRNKVVMREKIGELQTKRMSGRRDEAIPKWKRRDKLKFKIMFSSVIFECSVV